ncbi:MAG: histidine kinase [Saprospiraceae bacterium]|nr:histidine kinase [Saprospiraceae bacterium]
MLKLLLYIILSSLVFPLESYTQVPYTWQITDRDGLPSMEIYGLMQDSRGYMWIATDGGTCRYDGKELKLYEHSDRKGNATARIREDKNGNVWFKNFSGQLFYVDHQTDSLHLFEFPKELDKDIYFNYDFWNQSLIITTTHLYFFNLKTLEYQQKIFLGKSTRNNHLNVISDRKAWIFKPKREWWSYIDHNATFLCKTPTFGNQNTTKHTVKNYTKDSVLLLSENGKGVYLLNKKKPCHPTLDNLIAGEDFVVSKGFVDAKFNIWLATNKGLCLIERRNNQLLSPKIFFPEHFISYVTEDREGNIWFGTLGNGVFVMPSRKMFYYSQNESTLLSTPVNKLLAVNSKHIALGHDKGKLSYLNTETLENLEFQGDSENKVTAMYFDKQTQRLYFCARLISYLQLNDLSRVYSPNPTLAIAAHSLAVYKQHQLLVGFNNGIYSITLYPEIGKTVTPPGTYHPSILKKGHFIYHPFFRDSVYRIDFRIARTNAILANRYNDNEFWVAYVDSLFKYKDGIVSKVLDNNQAIVGLDIVQTDTSTIWVGTVGHGLLKIVDGEITQRWTTENGTLDNYCRALKVDGDWIWSATNKGVFGLNTQTEEIRIFNQLDGLGSEEIRDVDVVNGHVWLATPRGLIFFDKNLSSHNHIPPLIEITSIKINQKEQDLSTAQHSLFVNYDQNNFELSFRSTVFKSRGNFTYEYRLQEKHQAPRKWITQSSQVDFARFQDLQPGQYSFEVRAVNEDGISSLIPASIDFQIYPPFWQTWWFQLLIYSIVAIILVGIVTLRYRIIQRRERIRHTINQLRTQALQSQMNPHFVFNAMSTIQSFWLHKQPKTALSYHSKFARLMRLIFEYSQETSIPLAEEIKFLKLYIKLEQVRMDQEVELVFDVDPVLLEDEIHIPPLLLQPIIENAFKHGLLHQEGKKKLSIHIKQQDVYLYCYITDNGIGRKASHEINRWKDSKKRKNSTLIIKERLKILHQSIEHKTPKQFFKIIDLQSDQNNVLGTRIELLIPIV